MKIFSKINLKNFFKSLILAFACTFIHFFVCNYGGIYKYFLTQENNLFQTILDVFISISIITLALNLLFAINIFFTKILVLVANFIALIYSYFVVHLGIIMNEQIVISALFYAEQNDISSSFDSWIYLYVLPIFLLSIIAINFLQKKIANSFKIFIK